VQLRTTWELLFTTTQTPRTLCTTLTQHFALPRSLSGHSPESSLRLSQTSTITHATYEPLIHSFLLLMCSLCKHASQTTPLDTVVEHTDPSSCLSFLSIITHPLLRPPVPHRHTPTGLTRPHPPAFTKDINLADLHSSPTRASARLRTRTTHVRPPTCPHASVTTSRATPIRHTRCKPRSARIAATSNCVPRTTTFLQGDVLAVVMATSTANTGTVTYCLYQCTHHHHYYHPRHHNHHHQHHLNNRHTCAHDHYSHHRHLPSRL
jgi:hypothetical protein